MQMRLIDCLENKQENNKYGRCNEIILAQNSVTGLFYRLRVNTHTPEHFLYRIRKSDPAFKVIRYHVNQTFDAMRYCLLGLTNSASISEQ